MVLGNNGAAARVQFAQRQKQAFYVYLCSFSCELLIECYTVRGEKLEFLESDLK